MRPLLLLSLFPLTPFAQTNDVVELLMQQRQSVRVAQLLAELGDSAPLRPHQHMAEVTSYRVWMEHNLAARRARADSLGVAMADSAASAAATAAEVVPMQWRKIAADEQGEFLDRYGEVFWLAIGTSHPSDSLGTPRLRALLNGLFGAPTRNAAALEQEGYAGSEYVQFEYWLVVNETIPVLVLDTDGPFGTGVLMASDETFADEFAAIKTDLLDRIAGSQPIPYADYYHSLELRKWFRTGFDGAEYFVRESRRPRWAGQRSRNEKWEIFR